MLNGGAYLKGRRAGDQILSMRADGIPGAGGFDARVLIRGRQASMSMNGRRFSMPLKASTKQQFDWSSTMVDLTRYVKQVKVREGRVMNGEHGATITGVIDTADHLSDVRVALFVAERTGLIRSAVINLALQADGKQAELELTYRLDSTTRAIAGL